MLISKVIKATDWYKKWYVTDYSLLSCSLMNVGYDKACAKRFGVSLPHQFYINSKEGVANFQSETENLEFSTFFAEMFSKQKNYAKEMAHEVIQLTHEFRDFMAQNKPSQINIGIFEKFKKKYTGYLPPYIAINRPADHLDKESASRILHVLQEARVISETLYEDTDDYLKQVVKVMQKKSKLDLNLDVMNFAEVEAFLRTNVLPERAELKRRSPLSGMYYSGEEAIYFGNTDVEKFEKSVESHFGLTRGLAKGQTASPGFARGRARVIHNPKNADFNEGEILITGMTRPDFVILMKRAGAIVTDAGGMLSHAAIVSRELKKPCVIGTQTATKAFKDGDMVEVDANNGVVRRISK